MNKYEITYSKHKIDILPFECKYYLNTIINYLNESYLVTKIANEKNLIKDFRLLCDLQNKNSELYSEMKSAINSFNDPFFKYIVAKSVSKKILDKSGTHINKGIKVVLYQNGAVRYLNSKSELIPIISIYF